MGTAGFVRNKGLKERHKGFVWGVYVSREARGKGAGREMMRMPLERAAAIEGIEQIIAAVVDNSAKPRQACIVRLVLTPLAVSGARSRLAIDTWMRSTWFSLSTARAWQNSSGRSGSRIWAIKKRLGLFSPRRLGSPPPELPNYFWILGLV